MTKTKRKLLIPAIFDVGTLDKVFDIPQISIYIYPDDTLEVFLKCGFSTLPMYDSRVKLDMIKEYKNIESIKEQCKYFLNSIKPNYIGEEVITDIYLSPLFHEIMYRVFGFINIDTIYPKKIVGIDFGVKTDLTLSNGVKGEDNE